MLVRLRDFAEVHRVSQRTVQICIKENYAELGEHIDRRGKQGTWLDEYAVQFLLERIKLPSKDEVLVPTAREAALMEQMKDLSLQLADAERRVAMNAEAAGKVLLLEEAKAEQTAKIDVLTRENAVLSRDIDNEKVEHQKTKDEAQRLSERLSKIEGSLWFKLFGGKLKK